MDGMFDITKWKTPCCNAKTKPYRATNYPYDSGKECTKCGRRWSELQIARGEHLKNYDKKQKDREALEQHLGTPRDIINESLENQANILTLHFIGFIPKPIGISNDTYSKCLEAFSNNRGQFEWEMEAVLEILKEYENE